MNLNFNCDRNPQFSTLQHWLSFFDALDLSGRINVIGTGKIYSYTPWNSTLSKVEGTIYGGDIRRDGSDNVILDNKGGFVIKSGAECIFKAGSEIRLMNSFIAEAGSNFIAQIVSAPDGFFSPFGRQASSLAFNNEISVEGQKEIDLDARIRVYPNPIMNEITIEYDLNEKSLVSYVI